AHPPPVFPPSLPSTSAPLLQTTPAQLPSAQNRPNVPTAFPVAFETACQQLGPLPLSAHPSSANPTRSHCHSPASRTHVPTLVSSQPKPSARLHNPPIPTNLQK